MNVARECKRLTEPKWLKKNNDGTHSNKTGRGARSAMYVMYITCTRGR